MKKTWIGITVATWLAFMPAPPARAGDTWVGVKAGSLGAGIEVGTRLTGDLQGRLGIFGFNYAHDFAASGIDYQGGVDLRHAVALIDWHPGGSIFRLTGGLVANNTELKGHAPLRALIEDQFGGTIPGGIELPQDLGSLDARIQGNSLCPYAGFGLGRGVGDSGHWGFSMDVGVYYQGKPDAKLKLNTTLPVADYPGAQELLDAATAVEQAQLQKVVSDYPWFPVVMFGFTYRY